MRYTRAFTVGSEALLRFVAEPYGGICPILILLGAKNMTDE